MKYIILFASVLAQICLGGLYAWSAFVPDLKASYSLTTAQTQIIFGALIAIFTLTMVFAGKRLESHGPRFLMLWCGALFAIGYAIAAFSGGTFLVLFLGISGIVGVATGLGYICPMSVGMKWFPNHKGLVTGIAVAGFGGGAILLANIAEYLLKQGFDTLRIFWWVGIIYGITIAGAGLVMRFPPDQTPKGRLNDPSDYELPARDPYFWALAIAMFCATFAGLLVIGNLMPIALASGITPAKAAVGISAFAIGNAVGRICWGKAVDVMESKSVRNSLLLLALALFGLQLGAGSSKVFILASLLIGFGFGACFVIHAALVALRYGAHCVGRIYPLIFLSYGVAGITGPAAGGWLYDTTSTYSWAIGISITFVICSLVVSEVLIRRAKAF